VYFVQSSTKYTLYNDDTHNDENHRKSKTEKIFALVVAGGIAGMQSSLDLTDQGYQVALVEKERSIGGKYVVMMLIYRRWKTTGAAHSNSRTSDWLFMVILWLAGVAGFIIEIALYLPNPPVWGYWIFLFYAAISIELLSLLPFLKFCSFHLPYLCALYSCATTYFEDNGRAGRTNRYRLGSVQSQPACQ